MSAARSNYRLGLAGIAIAAFIALFALPSAAAEDSKASQHFKHYIHCLTWLLTDPAMHAANCTPSRLFEFPDQAGGPFDPFTISLVSTGAWTDSCDDSVNECEEPPCEGPGCEEPPCEGSGCEEQPPPCEGSGCEEQPCIGTGCEEQPCEGTGCLPP